MKRPSLVCIVGPTASGKTALSIAIAKAYGGEIVSADSMQIYRGLDIGTAKPTQEERAGIPHHMLDVVSPFEEYSVARYVEEATGEIDKILARGSLPIVVGGTGLYIDALVRGAAFAGFSGDADYRAELTALVEREGGEALLEKLAQVDPIQAKRLHPNDSKRIIRALEVYHTTGKPISAHNEETRDTTPRYSICWIGLTFQDRALLYERIDARVDAMLQAGLREELARVKALGLSREATAMQAIGYKELWEEDAGSVERLKQATRRYAKRQLTWFRRNPDIHWINVDTTKNFAEILQASTDSMKNCGIL